MVDLDDEVGGYYALICIVLKKGIRGRMPTTLCRMGGNHTSRYRGDTGARTYRHCDYEG